MTEEEGARRERRDKLISLDLEPYPKKVDRSLTVAACLGRFEDFLQNGQAVVLVGRVRAIRKHGGLTFVKIEDGSGAMQVALRRDGVGSSAYELFHNTVDVADFLEVTGKVFRTKTQEPSLAAQGYRLVSKALLPLPEKWHGLVDTERRYRERELDLLSNPLVRQRFVLRSKIISELRQWLNAREFLEVETPILQAIPGGANARPFKTHHNALDIDLYLRIAPELYLKRLIVGGLERVYEIGRNFRNEGIDHAHNPEFTSLELYWAYVGKEEFLRFMEEIVFHLINILGHSEIFLTPPWPRLTFREAILNVCAIDIDAALTPGALAAAVAAQRLTVDFSGCVGLGEYYDELFKSTARPHLIEPTWIMDYPLELKPLAAQSPDDPSKSASAQLIVQGMEIINAYYHELNDPLEQLRRFEGQEALRAKGSEVAQQIDQEFIRALKHGLPPTAGMAIGLDRFIALLTGAPSLKEIILFPTLRPE